MLSRFLTVHRAKKDDDDANAAGSLTVTYCVAGESADPATGNAQIHLRLVRESGLERAKKSLIKVTGVYLYRFTSFIYG